MCGTCVHVSVWCVYVSVSGLYVCVWCVCVHMRCVWGVCVYISGVYVCDVCTCGMCVSVCVCVSQLPFTVLIPRHTLSSIISSLSPLPFQPPPISSSSPPLVLSSIQQLCAF